MTTTNETLLEGKTMTNPNSNSRIFWMCVANAESDNDMNVSDFRDLYENMIGHRVSGCFILDSIGAGMIANDKLFAMVANFNFLNG